LLDEGATIPEGHESPAATPTHSMLPKPSTYTDMLGYLRPTDDSGPGSGPAAGPGSIAYDYDAAKEPTTRVCGGGPGVGIHAGIGGGVTYTVILDVKPAK